MENDKNPDFDEEKDSEYASEPAPRARNRTVMLTPDITGEVRARLAQELSQPAPSQFAPARGGFESPSAGTYAPAGELRAGRSEGAQGGGFHAPQQHSAVAQQPHSNNTPKREAAFWSQESPLVGFLVSYDVNPNGSVFELRAGRMIVTSEPAGGGNYILINDSSVSPMHAIMRISSAGEIQVLDQLSEFGTRVLRFGAEEEEELSGEKSSLEHGDVIKFGNRKFHVCIVAKSAQ